jgi:hypothetical protein
MRFHSRVPLLAAVLILLAVCLAATAALTYSGAHANLRPVKNVGLASAQRLARETAALEAKGYVPVACTVTGTLMRDYHTGRSVIVPL